MIIGRKKEIAMLRDAYESELPRHIIHLSGRHYHHLIISVSSAYNPCSFNLRVFFEHGFIGLTRMLRSVGGTVFQPNSPSMPLNNQNPQPTTYFYIFLFIDIFTSPHT